MYLNRKHNASDFVSVLASGNFFSQRNNGYMENRIRELRESVGLSQEELGRKIGTTRATISKLEKGNMNLTQWWMVRLANGLGCTPATILTAHPLKSDSAIDDMLMQKCANAITRAAQLENKHLELAIAMVYTVKLYKHIREIRSLGELAEPSISDAALILAQKMA